MIDVNCHHLLGFYKNTTSRSKWHDINHTLIIGKLVELEILRCSENNIGEMEDHEYFSLTEDLLIMSIKIPTKIFWWKMALPLFRDQGERSNDRVLHKRLDLTIEPLRMRQRID